MKRSALALAMFVWLGAASTAHATSFTLSSCLTGACGAVTGQVDLTLGSTDGLLSVLATNGTNGSLGALYLSYFEPLPATPSLSRVTLQSPGAESVTVCDETSPVRKERCSSQTGLRLVVRPNGTNGGFEYDIEFDLPNANGLLVAPNAAIELRIASTSPSFDVDGFSNAMAHVQRLGDGGNQSAKLTTGTNVVTVVPEPLSSVGALALGLAAIGGFARRVRRRG